MALDAHGFIDEKAEAFGEAVVALLSQELQDVVQEIRIGRVGHVVLMLDVFADTPTGNQCGPPSTSFSRAPLHPFGDRLRCGSLRSPPLRLTPKGWRQMEERQFTERLLHPQLASCAGVSFEHLIATVIAKVVSKKMGLQRHSPNFQNN